MIMESIDLGKEVVKAEARRAARTILLWVMVISGGVVAIGSMGLLAAYALWGTPSLDNTWGWFLTSGLFSAALCGMAITMLTD